MTKSLLLLLFLCATALNNLPQVCTYGKYVTDPMTETECKDCPEGKFRDTVKWNVQCKDCPAGEVSGAGSIACQNSTTSETTEEGEGTSAVAAGGVGLAAGATISVVYYTSST